MKTQNPWMGRFKGSAGNMTGCKVYDKNVLRAKAFEVSNPNTTAQQTQRNFFKQLAGLVATFSDEQLRTLFGQKPKAMSRRNALSKQLAVSYVVVNGRKEIDYNDITTLGNAPTMDFGETQVSLSRGTIVVRLDNNVSNNTSLSDYHFIVALVNAKKGVIYMPCESASVNDGALTLSTPADWTDNDNVFAIPLVTNSTTQVADKGFGSFIIKQRPEKIGRNRPAPFDGVTIQCSGLDAWDTFTIDLSGTPAEGLTPYVLESGDDTLCSSFNNVSEDIYTGSFLMNVENPNNCVLTCMDDQQAKPSFNVRFVVAQ